MVGGRKSGGGGGANVRVQHGCLSRGNRQRSGAREHCTRYHCHRAPGRAQLELLTIFLKHKTKTSTDHALSEKELQCFAVDTIMPSQRRDSQRRTHCRHKEAALLKPLHLGIIQDTGVTNSWFGTILCPQAIGRVTLHLLATVVEILCLSHRVRHPLELGPWAEPLPKALRAEIDAS